MQNKPLTDRDQLDMIKHRAIENAHIFLWLLKDTCWALFWKPGGIFMIVPTLCVAFYILWRSRAQVSEFIHNLAVCFWISANSIWMLTEFMGVEKLYKKYAIGLFICGIVLLVVYYVYLAARGRKSNPASA